MAVNEGCRATPDAFVINVDPDICLTPIGGDWVPVPYTIIGFFGDVANASGDVQFTGQAATNMDCFIPAVIGNEAGTGGGIKSGVNLGACRPSTACRTVFVNGQQVVFHTSTMDMNCNGLMGVHNCVGVVAYLVSPPVSATIQPDGTIVGDTNPVAPLTPEEQSWWDMSFSDKVTDTANRVVGVLIFAGGALETAAGVAMVTAGGGASGTGVGALPGVPVMIFGGVVTLHGIDTMQSGARQAWTGELTNTLTQDGIDYLVYGDEVPEHGITVGLIADFGVGLGGGLGKNLLEEGGEVTAELIIKNHEAAFAAWLNLRTRLEIYDQLDRMNDGRAPIDAPPPVNFGGGPQPAPAPSPAAVPAPEPVATPGASTPTSTTPPAATPAPTATPSPTPSATPTPSP